MGTAGVLPAVFPVATPYRTVVTSDVLAARRPADTTGKARSSRRDGHHAESLPDTGRAADRAHAETERLGRAGPGSDSTPPSKTLSAAAWQRLNRCGRRANGLSSRASRRLRHCDRGRGTTQGKFGSGAFGGLALDL